MFIVDILKSVLVPSAPLGVDPMNDEPYRESFPEDFFNYSVEYEAGRFMTKEEIDQAFYKEVVEEEENDPAMIAFKKATNFRG